MSRAHDRAIAAILAVYREHAAGGRLHVVLDDWNLADETLAWCAAQGGLTAVEADCLAQLRRLTESERRIVLAAAEVDMEAQRPW